VRSNGLQLLAVRRVPGIGGQVNLTPTPAEIFRKLYTPRLERSFDMIRRYYRRVL
jgi:hypothetical protein